MKLNPTNLSWAAPTKNADGSPITYALEYEIGVLDADAGAYQPFLTLPGQLQTDNRYEVPIARMALGPGEHTIALRAFAQEEPARKSVWSEGVTFRIAEIPGAPLDLRVA